jgi:DNA primase
MSRSVIDEIKDRIDIVDYVGRFVSDLKKQGALYKACCPFHSEKTPSFVVNPNNQTWRCFGQCAEGGDLLSFAMKRHGWSFGEALQELGKLAGVETQRERTPQQREQDAQRDRLRGLLQTAADYYHQHLLSDDPAAEAVREYAMLKRGLTMETIRRFQIGFAPDGWTHMLDALTALGYTVDEVKAAGVASTNDKGRVYDRFRNRLMIPIRDERSRVTGFGARALNPDDNPKYLNSPQSALFDKSRTLFALDVAKGSIRQMDYAVIVEGYMDAIQAHQAGYTNVIAQMGTALTDAQLKLLVPRYTTRLVLALDADAAGQNAMRRSLEVARETLATQTGKLAADIRIMQITSGKDPDDVLRETPELWQQYVDDALPIADFVIQLETATLPPTASVIERQKLAQSLIPILTASENNSYNRENLQKLALALRLDERDLFDWADALRRTAKAKPPQPSTVTAPAAAEPPPPLPPLDASGSSEEPPPFFGDDGLTYAPAEPSLPLPALPASPVLRSRHASRAAELECLRLLVHSFDFYYQINRAFRQLCSAELPAAADEWGELTSADFVETDLRLILELLVAAHHQEDHPPMTYVEQALDDTLFTTWERLLVDELAQIEQTVAGRLRPELDDIYRQQQRVPLTESEVERMRLRRVLEVRDKRLRRDLAELRFLLQEASDEAVNDLLQQVQQVMRVQAVFQRGLAALM